MGRFTRDRQATIAPAAPSSPQPSFGHAAFDPADIDDARRGHPAVSLQAFATANGLDYRNAEIFNGFLSTLPLWPEYTFNMCRGVFPGGRLGQVGHELLEMAASEGSIRAGGTFYDVRVTTRRSMREMMNLGSGDPDNAPFAGNAVWIPTTSVHVRTPELNQLPVLTIREAGTMSRSRLDDHGLPGFRLHRGPEEADALLTAVATACRPALTTRGDAYIRLRLGYGAVSLTVNGYRTDERDLRHLVDVAAHIAHSIGALTRPATGEFATAGPPCGSVTTPAGVPLPHPSYLPAYAQVAGELNLVHEDPWSLAHLLPRCPIPGVASGVLFGTLPGTSDRRPNGVVRARRQVQRIRARRRDRAGDRRRHHTAGRHQVRTHRHAGGSGGRPGLLLEGAAVHRAPGVAPAGARCPRRAGCGGCRGRLAPRLAPMGRHS